MSLLLSDLILLDQQPPAVWDTHQTGNTVRDGHAIIGISQSATDATIAADREVKTKISSDFCESDHFQLVWRSKHV